MKVTDLRFRYYNGEDECPFPADDTNKQRWWHQESTVAGRPDLAIEDFETRDRSEWPKPILEANVTDGEKAVALSGYLNTKQWGDLAGELDGYFDEPLNSYSA